MYQTGSPYGSFLAAPPPDDDDDLGAIDYNEYFDGGGQLAGWTDDLAKIGVSLAKGAVSGALNNAAGQLAPRAVYVAPPAAGMSNTVKLAIAAAVAVPVLYLLTRSRGGGSTVKA